MNPGELICSNEDIVIKTVLGSCVGITLYDKEKKIGGMCHFLLPYSSKNEASTKFGNIAIPLLIKKMLAQGASKKNLIAKVFGGANVIFDEKEFFFIGEKNIELATKLLKEYSIPIKEINVGGEIGKKVLFYTHSGLTVVENIKKMSIHDLYNPTL